MIIDSVHFVKTNPNVEVSMNLRGRVQGDAYILRSASGLGATDVDIFQSDLYPQGSFYHGQRPSSRELVFTIELNKQNSAGETPEALRGRIYSFFSINDEPMTVFLGLNGLKPYKVEGWISKVETALFDPGNLIQVTIKCGSPYFTGRQVVENWGENPTWPKIIMYEGTAPTGFVLNWNMTDAYGFEITLVLNGKTFKMGPILSYPNSSTAISTVPGNRYYTRVYTEPVYSQLSLLPFVSAPDGWPLLRPGQNSIAMGFYNGVDPGDPQYNFHTFQYDELYLGV